MDFASTVENLLENTESVIQVRHTTEIDATSLKQLIQNMARKIQLQDLELQRQQDVIESLAEEVRTLRAQGDDVAQLKRDTRRLNAELENLATQQRMQGQRVERLRGDVEEVARAPRPLSSIPPHTTGLLHSPPQAPPPTMRTDNTSATANLHSSAVAAGDSSTAQFAPVTPSSAPIGAPPGTRPSTNQQQQRAVAGLDLVETSQGLKIVAVKPGGPAQQSGFAPGDIVIRVGNKDVHRKQDFVHILEECVPGQGLDIVHRRSESQPARTTMLFLGGAPMSTPRRH